mgnify:CR=1 FL=1
MTEYKQVEDDKDYIKDMHSKAVINTNKTAYMAAVQRKKVILQQKDELRDATRAVSYTHLTLPTSDLV